MEDPLPRGHGPARFAAQVRVAVVLRKVCRRDVDPDAMPGTKAVCRRPHVHVELIDSSWLEQRRSLLRISIAGTQDSVLKVDRAAVRKYVRQPDHEVGVDGGRAGMKDKAQRANDVEVMVERLGAIG